MQSLIAKFIEISPVLGISYQTLLIAAERSKNKDSLYQFYGRLDNFLTQMEAWITQKAIENIDLDIKSISKKIEMLIWHRLLIYSGFFNFRDFLKLKIRSTLKPKQAIFAGKQIWSIADSMWSKVQANPTDFSFYTKRTILSSVYSAVILKFSSDYSDQFEETRQFLKRRIKNIVSFTKFKIQAKDFFSI